MAENRPFKPIRSLRGRVHRTHPTIEPPVKSTAVDRVRRSLVDSAVYVDGDRVESPSTLADSFRALRAHENAVAWIGFYRPEEHEVASLATEFGLHELVVEDAIVAHQRPKIERYDDTLFVVLRPARYLDDLEEVEFGEVHVFVGSDFLITLRHSEAPDLRAVRRRLESNPDLLQLGPEAILYAILA